MNDMFSLNKTKSSGLGTAQNDELAFLSFLDKFFNSGHDTSLRLNVCAFTDALYSLYLKENKQKILILYLHNHDEDFSTQFCRLLSEDNETKNLLETNFILHAWDVGEDKYQPVLMDTLSSIFQLVPCVDMVRKKQSALIFIAAVDMDFQIFTVIRDISALGNIHETMSIFVEELFLSDMEINDTPEQNEKTENDCGYVEFQQKMFDWMGNRDYDRFEANELEILKEKISYALFGVPLEVNGYSAKQKEEAQKMYDIIVETNNEFSEFDGQITMAILYNCLVPTDSASNLNYSPVPVFILRKCFSCPSENPCRIVIDHTRRVYKSWTSYLEDNKFCKCLMVVPEDGRYQGDENGRIKLQTVTSPACGLGRTILKASDITTSILGIGSSAVIVAAAVPAITVAPIALLGAAAVGAGVGVYSIGRSISTLVDRGLHRESLNVKEPEARGAYLNIAAGAVGFAGAGANAVVSQMAANGVTVGTTARVAVNTLGVANIGISGLAVTTSAVDIFMRWWVDDEPPSPLSVLQLSTSILFFGHAVYSFKSASTIIEESQTSFMQRFKDSLGSNKQRKMLRKLELETIRLNAGNTQRGRAEVIAAISKLRDKTEVFSFLSKNNRKFNELGVKFSATGGQVNFNGIALDLTEISHMSQKDAYTFFSDLPKQSSDLNVNVNSAVTSNSFKIDVESLATIENAFAFMKVIVAPLSLRDKICELMTRLLDFLEINNAQFKVIELLNDIFPNGRRFFGLLKMILSFVQKKVEEMQVQMTNGDLNDLDGTILKYFGNLDDAERKLALIQHVCDCLLLAFRSGSRNMEDLLRFCVDWVLNAYMEHVERQERDTTVQEGRRKEKIVNCKECCGQYYEN